MPFTDIRRPSILDSNAVADKFKLCSKDYNELSNKPTINGCILQGDISFDALGLPEVVACCTQAYAEGCIFPYVDNCLACFSSEVTECIGTVCTELTCCIDCTKTELTNCITTIDASLLVQISETSCCLTECINTVCNCLSCSIATGDEALACCIDTTSSDLTACINEVCTELSCDIADINSLVPAQASVSNQLADKNFVNSTVGTNTAHYIKYNDGPFPSVACLEAYSGCLTNNDYAFVCGIDSCGNAYYDRYKYTIEEITTEEYTTDQGSWGCEYRLNNSSFTASQWAAISSGVTAGMIPADAGDSSPLITKAETQTCLNNKVSCYQGTSYAGQVLGINDSGNVVPVESVTGRVESMTQAEYDALPPEEQNNGQIRHITDAPEVPVPFAVVNDTITTSANVWTAQKVNNEISSLQIYIKNQNILSDAERIGNGSQLNSWTAQYDGFIYINRNSGAGWEGSISDGTTSIDIRNTILQGGSISESYPFKKGDVIYVGGNDNDGTIYVRQYKLRDYTGR